MYSLCILGTFIPLTIDYKPYPIISAIALQKIFKNPYFCLKKLCVIVTYLKVANHLP